MNDPSDYMLVRRFLSPGEGWRAEEIKLPNISFLEAGRQLSAEAKRMDAAFGDSHFWTVDLYDDPKGPYGSYYQLFHGRTS